MKSWLVAFAALGLLAAGAGCHSRITPVIVSVPDTVAAGAPATIVVWTEQSARGAVPLWVNYIIDWGDDSVERTTDYFLSTDTAQFSHTWTEAGTFHVWMENDEDVRNANGSPGTRKAVPVDLVVTVAGNGLPVIDTVEAPSLAMRGVEVYLTVRASDPDGDSIRICVDWGDGTDTTSEYHQGPYFFGFYPTHTFTRVETARVVVNAEDRRGATSLPETALVRVDTTGGVIWCLAPPWASPLVVDDGVEECVYSMSLGGFDPPGSRFSAFTQDGAFKYATPHDSSPGGGAAYCAVTQHVIVTGRDLWAFDRKLHVAWRAEMPDSSGFLGWGGPAINGKLVYFARGEDTLYCYVDSVDHGGRIPAFTGSGAIVDAPVIDAQWAVYFGTDSGYLYKVGPWLDTMFWRVHLAAGKIHSPVVGSDGTIYCASESQSIYAIDPLTGTTRWKAVLDGQALRPAVGRTAIFVGTTTGKAYSIDPATGGINWMKVLCYPDGFTTAPAIAADGSVYFQSDRDVLYRVNQSDGGMVWTCDCRSYYEAFYGVVYPGKQERPAEFPPNPTILSNGNVIVAGEYGLFCVAGSRGAPLDPRAPWPKWQHDLYNTGYVSGGR